MAIPALRFKRSLQLVALLGTAVVAVLVSVKTPAGIQGSGLRSLAVIGTVTTVGDDAFTVGGVSYPSSGATFKIDGKSGNDAQVHEGDVVSLSGTTTASGAQSWVSEVTFNGNVQGPVAGIDVQAGSFLVLQQTVHVDSRTLFGAGIEPAGLAGLQNGAVVEVSAFANSAGELVASRIELKGNNTGVQVVGALQALDGVRQTFRINSLAVNYGEAQLMGVLAEGARVMVQGTSIDRDGTLIASLVEALPAARGEPGSEGRIQGLITSFPSSAYFEVEGQPVAVDARTELHLHGPLGLDVAVKVSGTFDANGVLVASKVKGSN
ncbi:MAG: DUF5666 domain-containing protein [Steroidobacteraceae bacterium]